jgi:hypothetical protein
MRRVVIEDSPDAATNIVQQLNQASSKGFGGARRPTKV